MCINQRRYSRQFVQHKALTSPKAMYWVEFNDIVDSIEWQFHYVKQAWKDNGWIHPTHLAERSEIRQRIQRLKALRMS